MRGVGAPAMRARAAHTASVPAAFAAPLPAPPRRRARALCACIALHPSFRRAPLRAQLPPPQPDTEQSAQLFGSSKDQSFLPASADAPTSADDVLPEAGDEPNSTGEAPACADDMPTDATAKRVRLSLPTAYERKWLLEGGVRRGRSRANVRSISFSLRVYDLIRTAHPRLSAPTEVPPWAYVVHINTPKTVLGKRATTRNRAKRRIRAACARVLPLHAHRVREYIFTVTPDALVTPFDALVIEVAASLRAAQVYIPHLPFALARRRRSPSRTIPTPDPSADQSLDPSPDAHVDPGTIDEPENTRLAFADLSHDVNSDEVLDKVNDISDLLPSIAEDLLPEHPEHSNADFAEAEVLHKPMEREEGFAEAILLSDEESIANEKHSTKFLRRDEPDNGFIDACLVDEQDLLRSDTWILNTNTKPAPLI